MPRHWYEGSPQDGKAGAIPDGAKPDESGTGEKGDDKAALSRMGEQRDAARTQLSEVTAERDALLKEKQQREAADQKATEEAAEKRGEYEALAKKREAERDEARTQVAALTAEIDQLKTAMTTGLDEEFGKLPATVQKLWKGANDDVLGRFSFLHDADVQKLVTELEEKGEAVRGSGQNPKPGDDSKVDVEAARKSQAALYSNW